MKKGFTLFEILITIALMTTITLILFPFSISTISTTNLNVAADQLFSTLFTSQQDSYSGKNNLIWGVRLNSNSYTIISGSDINNIQEQDNFLLNNDIQIENVNLNNGQNQITFEKNKLVPSAIGSFEIYNSTSRYLFTINNEGLIEYRKI